MTHQRTKEISSGYIFRKQGQASSRLFGTMLVAKGNGQAKVIGQLRNTAHGAFTRPMFTQW